MNGLFGPILAPREFGRERQRSALSRAIESFSSVVRLTGSLSLLTMLSGAFHSFTKKEDVTKKELKEWLLLNQPRVQEMRMRIRINFLKRE